jgi:hypothetical protein
MITQTRGFHRYLYDYTDYKITQIKKQVQSL